MSRRAPAFIFIQFASAVCLDLECLLVLRFAFGVRSRFACGMFLFVCLLQISRWKLRILCYSHPACESVCTLLQDSTRKYLVVSLSMTHVIVEYKKVSLPQWFLLQADNEGSSLRTTSRVKSTSYALPNCYHVGNLGLNLRLKLNVAIKVVWYIL